MSFISISTFIYYWIIKHFDRKIFDSYSSNNKIIRRKCHRKKSWNSSENKFKCQIHLLLFCNENFTIKIWSEYSKQYFFNLHPCIGSAFQCGYCTEHLVIVALLLNSCFNIQRFVYSTKNISHTKTIILQACRQWKFWYAIPLVCTEFPIWRLYWNWKFFKLHCRGCFAISVHNYHSFYFQRYICTSRYGCSFFYLRHYFSSCVFNSLGCVLCFVH